MPVPHRPEAARTALDRQAIDECVARQAARTTLPGLPPSKKSHKVALFETLVWRGILKVDAS